MSRWKQPIIAFVDWRRKGVTVLAVVVVVMFRFMVTECACFQSRPFSRRVMRLRNVSPTLLRGNDGGVHRSGSEHRPSRNWLSRLSSSSLSSSSSPLTGGDGDHDMDMTGWTVDQVMTKSLDILTKNNIAEPDMAVAHLLAASMDLSWETGYREIQSASFRRNIQNTITSAQAKDFSQKLYRRLNHEPLQYILGQWDFLDYTLQIRSPLLCPRPETEELVMKIVAETTESPVHILDVGCGTGVIGLALADKLMDAFVQAIDIEPVAIETSLENAKIIFGGNDDLAKSSYHAILCSAEDYEISSPQDKFDIVVSNPPYIPERDQPTLSKDVINFESHEALFGGPDGMTVVRSIVQKLSSWCHSGGMCWMEVDPSHPPLIQEWINATPSLGVVFESSHKDMYGNERFVKIRVL